METIGVSIAGQKLGTAIGHFLCWSARRAANLGHGHIFFLSREGAFLARHYEAIKAEAKDGAFWPASKVLAVSRKSTLLPSMSAVNSVTLAAFFAQYPHATIGTLLDSLGINPPANLKPDELLAPCMSGQFFDQQLVDLELNATIEKKRIEQRELLTAYLNEQGFLASVNMVVLDIGWRGTIQNHLAQLLPATKISGLYLALFPALSASPSNTEKLGFAINPESSKALLRRMRFVAPLEFACSDETLSVVAYAGDQKAGGKTVVPVYSPLKIVPNESPEMACFADAIKRAAIATANKKVSADLTLQLLLETIELPTKEMIDLYFQAWRDDRYGGGKIRRGSLQLHYKDLALAAMSLHARKRVGEMLADSGWPWAVLSRDTPIIAKLLRKLVMAIDPKL